MTLHRLSSKLTKYRFCIQLSPNTLYHDWHFSLQIEPCTTPGWKEESETEVAEGEATKCFRAVSPALNQAGGCINITSKRRRLGRMLVEVTGGWFILVMLEVLEGKWLCRSSRLEEDGSEKREMTAARNCGARVSVKGVVAGSEGKSKRRVIRWHQTRSLQRKYSTTKTEEVGSWLSDPSIVSSGRRIFTSMTGQIWESIHLLLKGCFNVICSLNLLLCYVWNLLAQKHAYGSLCWSTLTCMWWCIYLTEALKGSQNLGREGFSDLFFSLLWFWYVTWRQTFKFRLTLRDSAPLNVKFVAAVAFTF